MSRKHDEPDFCKLMTGVYGTCSEITLPSLMKDTPSMPRVLTVTASITNEMGICSYWGTLWRLWHEENNSFYVQCASCGDDSCPLLTFLRPRWFFYSR